MTHRDETMDVGFVVYDGLDSISETDRYNRTLVEYLESQGDTVEIIDVSQHSYPRNLTDSFSPGLRRRLDRPFDILLEDELCHPSLWYHNPRLTEPSAIVSLVHLLILVAVRN